VFVTYLPTFQISFTYHYGITGPAKGSFSLLLSVVTPDPVTPAFQQEARGPRSTTRMSPTGVCHPSTLQLRQGPLQYFILLKSSAAPQGHAGDGFICNVAGHAEFLCQKTVHVPQE
jgi:hypothetical protein